MDSIESRIRGYLSLLGRRSKSMLDDLLLPYNITTQQARIIGFVCSEQREGKVICQKDIEEAFELRGSSITSLLQGLERKNFIRRHSDPSDERRKIVDVLLKGQELMSNFEKAFHDIDQQMVRNLSTEQKQTLLHTLEQMAHNLE